jgi:cell wall-associated NlpC family hydrolase
MLCSEALAAAIPVYINTSTRIYNRPSTSSSLSIRVPKNMTCSLMAINGSWALVHRDGVNAFIPLKYLTLKNRLTGYAAASTTMYAAASTSSRKLGTVSKGTELYVVGRDGSFFAVENANGAIRGYIRATQISPTRPKVEVVKPSVGNAGNAGSSENNGNTGSGGISGSLDSTTNKYSPDMSNAQKLEYVIYVAQNLVCRPYDADPSIPYSFDCSRFVKYCFEQAEIDVPASSQTQGYDDGYTKISAAGNLKRGDLVCFNTNSTDDDLCDHTGIYIGSGYFIHASSGAGKVIVSTLSSGYYKNTFTWGRRILK